jgi:hypothetical protein
MMTKHGRALPSSGGRGLSRHSSNRARVVVDLENAIDHRVRRVELNQAHTLMCGLSVNIYVRIYEYKYK